MSDGVLSSSFRDPSGFLFRHQGELYRQVNRKYAADLDRLHDSGLYDLLVAKELVVRHEEASLELAPAPELAEDWGE